MVRLDHGVTIPRQPQLVLLRSRRLLAFAARRLQIAEAINRKHVLGPALVGGSVVFVAAFGAGPVQDCGMADDVTTLIRWGDLQSTPWKNGGGTTREVAAHPVDDPDFDWRVSIADVEQSGPFSTYPGVDRIITLVEGERMVLGIGGTEQVLEPFEPFRFSGDETVTCTLPSGATRDLNLMTRRDRAAGVVGIHRAPAPVELQPCAGRRLLIALPMTWMWRGLGGAGDLAGTTCSTRLVR